MVHAFAIQVSPVLVVKGNPAPTHAVGTVFVAMEVCVRVLMATVV
jgi:hypothetical protein